MGPGYAPAGTVAVICPSKSTLKTAHHGPPCAFESTPKHTDVAPVKLLPRIVTEVPTAPLPGDMDVTTGVGRTVKLDPEVAVSSVLVTVMGPLTAPGGTQVMISPSLTTL